MANIARAKPRNTAAIAVAPYQNLCVPSLFVGIRKYTRKVVMTNNVIARALPVAIYQRQ